MTLVIILKMEVSLGKNWIIYLELEEEKEQYQSLLMKNIDFSMHYQIENYIQTIMEEIGSKVLVL